MRLYFILGKTELLEDFSNFFYQLKGALSYDDHEDDDVVHDETDGDVASVSIALRLCGKFLLYP